MSDKVSQQAIDATRNWLLRVVVGLNFCPFAKPEVDRHSIRYQVSSADTPAQAISDLLSEVYLLEDKPEIETTLLIFPFGFADFDDFLDMLGMADGFLDQSGYRGIYQLANFHPDYCFDGEEQDDPANFTNRAPYPTLHLIREASLENALASVKHPEKIPETNINKARKLGFSHMQALLKECLDTRQK